MCLDWAGTVFTESSTKTLPITAFSHTIVTATYCGHSVLCTMRRCLYTCIGDPWLDTKITGEILCRDFRGQSFLRPVFLVRPHLHRLSHRWRVTSRRYGGTVPYVCKVDAAGLVITAFRNRYLPGRALGRLWTEMGAQRLSQIVTVVCPQIVREHLG